MLLLYYHKNKSIAAGRRSHGGAASHAESSYATR
jgi:hypothetical protein